METQRSQSGLVDLQQLGFALVPAFLILWQGGWRRTA
jgi:hypothetical protein